MTGRELIIYILKNGLENEEVFKDGKILGYVTVEEAALRTGFGPATIITWISMGILEGCIQIGTEWLIPETSMLLVMSKYYPVQI